MGRFGLMNKKRRYSIGLLLFLVFSCSRGEQHNDHPLLATNWGGTSGGAITGRLEVQVFDDTTRFPFPGAVVSLGATGKQTVTTDGQGIALFTNVFGPQDIHVYACAGCDADPNDPAKPLFYQIASLYQVDASQISIPMITRDLTVTNGTMQGKVFEVAKEETAHVVEVDELGNFRRQGPLLSSTYQVMNDESATDLLFIYNREVDDWAAADPAGGKQGFGTVALVGKAINGSKQPQAGVRVNARYFPGNDAGRAYYFNDLGQLDPALDQTTTDGRFVFLRLDPNNDILVSAESLGVGVGARYLHLRPLGTTVFSLPVLPLTGRTIDLSGRVVNYRLDFREEERKGPLSSQNGGVESAVVNFSGDPIDQSIVSDSGAQIAGNYRSNGHLLPNSKYIAVILSGRNFRPTYQEVQLNDRAKFNYPLAAVPLADLVNMVRTIKSDDTSGLATDTAEILGRIVTPTGSVDPNGDPVMVPVADAKITVIDDSGNEITTRAYFNSQGAIDPSQPALDKTSASGGFLVYGLTQGVYTVIATDAVGNTIGRKTFPVYANTVRLVELVQKTGTLTLGQTLGADLKPIAAPLLALQGGKSSCSPVASGCVLSSSGEYIIQMENHTGGGDYQIPVPASKRALGLSAFRVSPDGTLNNVTFAGGLGPLGTGGTLSFDISFLAEPPLVPTDGSVTLPSTFTPQDLNGILVGSVSSRGETFIGADATTFSGKGGPTFHALSLRPEGALSYFLVATAQNAKGEASSLFTQGLLDIPSHQDLVFPDPPRLTSPAPNEAVVADDLTQPHLVWTAPEGPPVDLYRVLLDTSDGQFLWEAWVPGNQTEITLPNFPATGLTELKPFPDGQTVVWRVHAIRAGGLSLQEFTFGQLSQQRVSDARAESRFTIRRSQP
ncbi:MAG: hypothetical protein HY282_05355 [Nitrospirae bacterium]|nr:hypothetical protein [Candidatus Manganitrophaceae bacterium]